MKFRILTVLFAFCAALSFGQESSSSVHGTFELDSAQLAELETTLSGMVEDGLMVGFGIISLFAVTAGGVIIVLHLINRGVGH